MILIIGQDKRVAKDISEIFYYMSVLSHGTDPKKGLSEISTLYRGIIILEPLNFPDISDYVRRIRSYNSSVPIYALSSAEYNIEDTLFDYIYSGQSFSTLLANDIIDRFNKENNAKIGTYKLAGFNSSYNSIGVEFFNDSIKFTKTEAMILRYLIRSYPLPQCAKNILKYSFKPSRAPEEYSIKTHISMMNKRFMNLTGRKMIELVPQKGYRIITPEPK